MEEDDNFVCVCEICNSIERRKMSFCNSVLCMREVMCINTVVVVTLMFVPLDYNLLN